MIWRAAVGGWPTIFRVPVSFPIRSLGEVYRPRDPRLNHDVAIKVCAARNASSVRQSPRRAESCHRWPLYRGESPRGLMCVNSTLL